ncbi:hypothetical protein [Aliidiomarina haloalkalitolerans]|uniref:Lipoprotein n=1 Tax=Aliidiomarina haloalkalitolerans TaxID=859059 RepID=A0A432VUK9_9GAMM|nr:hypothetical protein [Aliidiomarina haloalkalitolerans]RUO20165.1 hypothetical protein CWE06_05945 [Aliidiomarina haloalkalitolerans]
MKKLALLAFFSLTLTACSQEEIVVVEEVKDTRIDQSNICIYSTDDEAKLCVAGKLSFFKPTRWGNAQLPILVAAAYCDTNYQVIYNESGVLCVFTDERM